MKLTLGFTIEGMVLLQSRNELKYETNDDIYQNYHQRDGVEPCLLIVVVFLPLQAIWSIGSGGDVAESILEIWRIKSLKV